MANTNFFCLLVLFYHRHLYHMHITQKTREVGVTKRKKAYNIMESVQGLDTSKLLVWILAPLLLSIWPATYLSEFHSSIVMWKHNDTFYLHSYLFYLFISGRVIWVSLVLAQKHVFTIKTWPLMTFNGCSNVHLSQRFPFCVPISLSVK